MNCLKVVNHEGKCVGGLQQPHNDQGYVLLILDLPHRVSYYKKTDCILTLSPLEFIEYV